MLKCVMKIRRRERERFVGYACIINHLTSLHSLLGRSCWAIMAKPGHLTRSLHDTVIINSQRVRIDTCQHERSHYDAPNIKSRACTGL